MLYVVCFYRFNLIIFYSSLVLLLLPSILLLLTLFIVIICLFSLRFSFVGGLSPPVAGPLSPFSGFLPPVSAVTPLHVDQFALELKNHPNQPQLSFVLDGLSKGFRVGYNFPRKLKSAPRNKPSAYAHPGIVDAYLANEVSLGRVAGPFDRPPLPGLHISSFGVIPKKGSPANGV